MKHSNVWILRRMCFGAMIVSVWILACVMATGIGIARIVLPGQSWQADMMSFIATESSPQGAIQFELGRLRMYADTYKQGQNEDIQDCSQILEAQGITVAVSQDGRLVYATSGSDPSQTVAGVEKSLSWQPRGSDTAKPDMDTAAMLWKDNTLAYQYISRKTGVQVAVLSHAAIPMFREYKGLYPLRMQKTWVCLFVAWLGLSGVLVWIVLSKRFMRHMLPYVQLYCNAQTNSTSCGSPHVLGNDQHTSRRT